MDEVLDALGIEDLTEEVMEEARKRDMLRKLQADRTDLAADVKKLLRALLGKKVKALEEQLLSRPVWTGVSYERRENETCYTQNRKKEMYLYLGIWFAHFILRHASRAFLLF